MICWHRAGKTPPVHHAPNVIANDANAIENDLSQPMAMAWHHRSGINDLPLWSVRSDAIDVLSCIEIWNPEFLVPKARDLWQLLAASKQIEYMPVFTSSAGKDTFRRILMSPASSPISRRCRFR
jgi:hypothetical protein